MYIYRSIVGPIECLIDSTNSERGTMVATELDKKDSTMPETDAKKVLIRFSVPAPLLEEMRAIAELEGWNESELHRMFWEKGFAQHCEGSNARMMNRKLREGEDV